jgi:hypothetical protein
MAEGFRARITNDVVPMAQRDPDALRNPIADGIEQLGKALGHVADNEQRTDEAVAASQDRIRAIDQKRARDAALLAGSNVSLQRETSARTRLAALATETDPAGPEYEEKAAAILKEEADGAMAGVPDDPEVYDRIAADVVRWSTPMRGQVQIGAMRARAVRNKENYDQYSDGLLAGLVSEPTPGKMQESVERATIIIRGTGIAAGDQDKLIGEFKGKAAQSMLDGQLMAGNGAGVKTLLNSGQLDATLGADLKTNYLQRANNAEQVAARTAELAQARVAKEALDQKKAIDAKIEAGIAPTPAEMRAVRANLVATGADEATLIDLDAANVRVQVNQRYSGKDAATIRTDRDALQAKVASGKASEAEQVMKAQLDKLVKTGDDKETDVLKPLLAKGAGGRMQALAQLSGNPQARYEKAEELEKGLGVVSGLSPRAQQYVLAGREARAARPKDFGKPEEAKRAFDGMIGPIAGSLGGQYDDLRDAAWDYMVGTLANRGQSGFDAKAFETGVRIATGATTRPNGAVQGGVQKVRGSAVLLPPAMTAPEFDTLLSRQTFAGAVYRNGAAVSKDDVLSHYRPEWIGDDDRGVPHYQMVDSAGGVLVRKDGKPFTLGVRRK